MHLTLLLIPRTVAVWDFWERHQICRVEGIEIKRLHFSILLPSSQLKRKPHRREPVGMSLRLDLAERSSRNLWAMQELEILFDKQERKIRPAKRHAWLPQYTPFLRFMPKKISQIAVALILAGTACSSGAIEPVTVLGLPIGGKVKIPIRECAFNEIGSQRLRSMCWVGSPSAYKGTRSGSLGLPNPDSRPKWAAYAMFDASIAQDGTLEVLRVKTPSEKDADEIQGSISARFGQAARTTNAQSIRSANWDKPDIAIHMLCAYDIGCTVEFASARYQINRERQVAERKAKDSARPVTP